MTFSRQHQQLRAFTLVEIMIIVALIVILTAVGVPNFLRARKRAQATRILDDLRMIDGAIDLYANENKKSAGDPAAWPDLQPYMKKNMLLYASNGYDMLGNPFNDGGFSVDTTPKVSSVTFAALSDIAPSEFWSPFAP